MFIAPLNSKRAISAQAHARAGGKRFEKDGPKGSSFAEILEGCFYLFKFQPSFDS